MAEEIRDGYLGDLPEDIQIKIMGVHKMIVDACNSEMKRSFYDDIRNVPRVKTLLDEFLVEPKDGTLCGSVRVYKKGKRYRCMIQVTGHPVNNRNTEDEEMFHGFIRNTHVALRTKIRRKYDVTLTCESEHGENFEGFDIWTKSKVAKQIWEKFEGKNTKIKRPEKVYESLEYTYAGIDELPYGLQTSIIALTECLNTVNPDTGLVTIRKNGEDVLGFIELTSINGEISFKDANVISEAVRREMVCKTLAIGETYQLKLDTEYANKLASWMNINEAHTPRPKNDLKYCYRIGFDINTGKQVAVQFELDPEQINAVSDDNIKRTAAELAGVVRKTPVTNAEFDNKSKSGIEKLKEKIKQWGHIDFRTHALKVHGITTRDGQSLQSVRMVGVMSGIVSRTIDNVSKSLGQEVSFMDMVSSPAFINRFKASVKSIPEVQIETYTKNQLGGEDKYKTTQLIWDRELMKAYRLQNSVRGKIDSNKTSDDMNMGAWASHYKNDIVNRYKPSKIKECVLIDDDCAFDIMDIYREAKSLSYIENGSGNTHYTPADMFPTVLAWYISEGFNVLYDNPEFEGLAEAEDMYDTILTMNETNIIPDKRTRERTRFVQSIISNSLIKEGVEMESTTPVVIFDPIYESDNTEYNTDLSPAAAKRTLGTVTQSIINDKDKKVNQYTADIFSNIISKNLLGSWVKGYRKLQITIDPKAKGSIFEFKIPPMTMDFISRFASGRESLTGFLHRSPDIRIRMSADTFKSIQNRDDAYNFFRAAVKYYDVGVVKYSEKIMGEVMRLPTEMKRLISTTKLSGIVSVPLQMLFSFDNVEMSTTSVFNISKEDIAIINTFIRNIYTKYAAPEKEKQKIISDLQEVVYHLRESCDITENASSIANVAEALKTWYNGGYRLQLEQYRHQFESENVDIHAMDEASHDLKIIYEKFGVKKLKKIPRDLVAYISIETDSIRDANDKMMIASYCLSKLEIVEWYIELLEVGSKKYVVPHSLPYLQSLRTQLLQCYDNIMKVKIIRPNERPLIDIKYPHGYEG